MNKSSKTAPNKNTEDKNYYNKVITQILEFPNENSKPKSNYHYSSSNKNEKIEKNIISKNKEENKNIMKNEKNEKNEKNLQKNMENDKFTKSIDTKNLNVNLNSNNNNNNNINEHNTVKNSINRHFIKNIPTKNTKNPIEYKKNVFSNNSYGNELALTALNTINSTTNSVKQLAKIEEIDNKIKEEEKYLQSNEIKIKKSMPKMKSSSTIGNNYANCNEIFQNDDEGALFLGDMFAATNMDEIKEKNIKAVLTMATGMNISYNTANFFASDYKKTKGNIDYSINHLVIPALDIESYKISKHFEKTYSFIDENLKKNNNILVHCAAGVSRSASAVIAYIMKRYNMDYSTAFNLVKKRRNIIYPNPGFVKQLKQYYSGEISLINSKIHKK